MLNGISSEELITDLFVSVDGKIGFELVKRFEKILIKSTLDRNFFKSNLHNFFIETNNFLKNNNAYKEFASFAYFIYSNLSSESINTRVIQAYQNLLLQQFSYISPGKLIYGISSEGLPMIMDEIYPKLDFAIYELEESKKRKKKQTPIELEMDIKRTFKKYGYDISTINELEKFLFNEMILTNMILETSNFINEDNLDIVPKSFYPVAGGMDLPRVWKDTGLYKDSLRSRKFMLPPNGVLGVYKNTKDIKTVFLKEIFMDNQIYLLYRVCDNFDRGIYGVYDTKTGFFNSPYKGSSGEGLNDIIENFVLENYCHLTTNIEIDRKRNIALKVVEDINSNDFSYPEQPLVEFLYAEKKYPGKGEYSKTNYKKYNKEKYKKENIEINPFIRRLPKGMTASEDAILKAREFGYELSEGETFVRPFTRKSFVLKNKSQ